MYLLCLWLFTFCVFVSLVWELTTKVEICRSLPKTSRFWPLWWPWRKLPWRSWKKLQELPWPKFLNSLVWHGQRSCTGWWCFGTGNLLGVVWLPQSLIKNYEISNRLKVVWRNGIWINEVLFVLLVFNVDVYLQTFYLLWRSSVTWFSLTFCVRNQTQMMPKMQTLWPSQIVLLVTSLYKPLRPFGKGTAPVMGLTNHSCKLLTNWDDPPSNGSKWHQIYQRKSKW